MVVGGQKANSSMRIHGVLQATRTLQMQAKLTGEAVPPPPARKDTARVRTYKTKNETDDKKGVTGPIVLTLLFIAVVVPMLQYWGESLID
jgi:hypothetical protein